MTDFLNAALSGLWTGVAAGAALAVVLLYLGKRRRWFDERTRVIKERAARPTLGIGFVLLLIALLWSQARPEQSSLAIFAVLVIEVAAFAAFYVHAARKL